MKLLINGEEIKFQIEDENTLPALVDSLVDWATERDLFFIELYVNGSQIDLNEVPERNMEKNDIIDCKIQSRSDLIISTLSEGAAYCDRVAGYIDNSVQNEKFDTEELQSLFTGIDWLQEMTTSVFQLLSMNISEVKYMDSTVAEYFNRIKQIVTDLSDMKDESGIIKYLSEKKELFNDFKGILKLALLSDNMKSVISKSVDSPDVLVNSLVEIKENLSSQMQNLEKVAEAYQTGRDNEAVELLQIFLDFIYSYTRICYQSAPVFNVDLAELIVDDIPLEKINNDLNSLLNEIIEVMENEDIVSLADILEYEITPLLSSLDKYIDILLNKIK